MDKRQETLGEIIEMVFMCILTCLASALKGITVENWDHEKSLFSIVLFYLICASYLVVMIHLSRVTFSHFMGFIPSDCRTSRENFRFLCNIFDF